MEYKQEIGVEVFLYPLAERHLLFPALIFLITSWYKFGKKKKKASVVLLQQEV